MTPGRTLRVGRLSVPVEAATDAVRRYVTHSDGVYAWPYYDRLSTGTGASELGDGDLLAPTLLNADPSIVGFASLQAHRDTLSDMLTQVSESTDLAEATDAQIEYVASLYGALDDPGLPGIQGTTLSKVLHRKRPRLIPLYDREVKKAYQKSPSPLPRRPRGGWSWVEFMDLLARAMRADLRADPSTWMNLCGLVPEGDLTALRALDIVAWTYGHDDSLAAPG